MNFKQSKFALIALALPISSFAAFSVNNIFVGAEGGYAFSNQFSLKPPVYQSCAINGACWDNVTQSFATTMGNSPVYGVRAGYQFNNFLSADIDYDNRNSFHWSKIFPGDPAGFPDPRKRSINKISNYTVMADLIITPNLQWEKLDPFLNAGIGAAHNDVGNLTSVDLRTGSSGVIAGHELTNFAWQIGGGLNLDLNSHVFADAGYRWVDIGHLETGTQVINPPPVIPIPRLKSDDVYLQEIYAGINFRA